MLSIRRRTTEACWGFEIWSRVEVVHQSSRVDGVLAVWSAREDLNFERRLRHGRFAVESERVRGRLKNGGPRHTIFLGHKTPGR